MSSSLKGKGIAIEEPQLCDSIDNVEVKTTFIEDYDRSNDIEDENVSKWENILSKGKSSSSTQLVISSNKKRKTYAVWECFPDYMIITIRDTQFAICKFCNKKLKLEKTYSTTHLSHHMKLCVLGMKEIRKQIVEKGQTLLGFS